MLKLSDQAVKQLMSIRPDRSLLRISVRGGGCSGLSYNLEWISEASATSDDHMVADSDLVYVIDKKSMLFLAGVELHYSNDINNYGFTWNNPNAKKTCGCGSSFS